MVFTDVIKEILNYNAKHFYEMISAFATLGLFFLTLYIAIVARNALWANTVSNARISYIASLRNSFIDLHSALLSKKNDTITDKIFSIKYYLNPYEEMEIDKKFINDCLDLLLNKARNNELISPVEIENYRLYSTSIIEYEWINFKKEIKFGKSGATKRKKKQTKKITIDNARKIIKLD